MASVSTSINETSICFTIDRIRELVTLHSSSITIQNLPWQITIFKSTKENTLGLRLTCLGLRGTENWSCAATASIELRSFKSTQASLKSTILPYVFSPETNSTSCPPINWNTLMDTNLAYVHNDRVKIYAKIMAMDSTNNKTNLQVVNRTNTTIKVNLTIHEASSLLAVSSTTFDFGNSSWKLFVVGPGYRPAAKTKLSVMLWCMKGISTSNWSRDILGNVSITSSIPDQPQAASPKKVMNFTEKVPKRFFTDTILWSDLVNPSRGFVHPTLNYLVIEVELKVQRMVDNGNRGGASAPAQAELPCTICFESMIGRSIVNTDCGHMYCKTCITSWISERPNCPLCDSVLTVSQLHQIYLP